MLECNINRRDFLKHFRFLAIAPFGIDLKNIDFKPYWLRVLSKGVEYFPFKQDKIDNDSKKIRKLAYDKIRYGAWQKYVHLKTGIIDRSDNNMKLLIDDYKSGQFLLENIEGEYTHLDDFPKVTFKSDPLRSNLLYDLSSIILYEIRENINNNISFGNFEYKLIKSSFSYSFESIATVLRALDIAPDYYFNALNTQLGKSYYTAAKGYEYSGKDSMAKYFFDLAKKVTPKDKDIEEEINYINQDFYKKLLPNLKEKTR